jgi:hypothetical protein
LMKSFVRRGKYSGRIGLMSSVSDIPTNSCWKSHFGEPEQGKSEMSETLKRMRRTYGLCD